MWDDGDDLYAEPRAPYPHAREVLLLRATAADSALLIGGYARTAEGQSLVESGWCIELVAEQAARRTAWPRLEVTDGSTAGSAPARLPREVFRAVRAAQGAVLMQVPRRGYRESLSCQSLPSPGSVHRLPRASRADLCVGADRLPMVRHRRDRAGQCHTAKAPSSGLRWSGSFGPLRSSPRRSPIFRS